MTHTYSAGGTRRTAVLMAIIGLHFAIFLVVAADLVPAITAAPEPVPPKVTLLPRKPEPRMVVRPDKPDPLDYASERVDEPIIPVPQVEDPMPPAVAVGQSRDGAGIAGQPVVVDVIAPRLRMHGDRLAALINACYPAAARRAGEEGRVLVRVLVGGDGRIMSWQIQQGSGFPRLDAAVRCIVDRLAIEPGRRDGRAIEAEALLPIVFRLD